MLFIIRIILLQHLGPFPKMLQQSRKLYGTYPGKAEVPALPSALGKPVPWPRRGRAVWQQLHGKAMRCAARWGGAGPAVPSVTIVPQHNSKLDTAWQSSFLEFWICCELKQSPLYSGAELILPSTRPCGDSPFGKLVLWC